MSKPATGYAALGDALDAAEAAATAEPAAAPTPEPTGAAKPARRARKARAITTSPPPRAKVRKARKVREPVPPPAEEPAAPSVPLDPEQIPAAAYSMLFGLLHSLAAIKWPEMALASNEADALGQATNNLASQLGFRPSPIVAACVTFGGVAAAVYGPRVLAIRARQAYERQAQVRPPAGVAEAQAARAAGFGATAAPLDAGMNGGDLAAFYSSVATINLDPEAVL